MRDCVRVLTLTSTRPVIKVLLAYTTEHWSTTETVCYFCIYSLNVCDVHFIAAYNNRKYRKKTVEMHDEIKHINEEYTM